MAGADRLGKNWALAELAQGERIPLLGEWLSGARIESPAAVLGLLSTFSDTTQTIALGLISLLCLGLVAAFYRALTPREFGTAAALGAIAAGVASNAFDRFQRGTALDFLHLGRPASDLPDFNLADIAILMGVVALIVELLANEMAARAEERSHE